jgi:hypothetical protein
MANGFLIISSWLSVARDIDEGLEVSRTIRASVRLRDERHNNDVAVGGTSATCGQIVVNVVLSDISVVDGANSRGSSANIFRDGPCAFLAIAEVRTSFTSNSERSSAASSKTAEEGANTAFGALKATIASVALMADGVGVGCLRRGRNGVSSRLALASRLDKGTLMVRADNRGTLSAVRGEGTAE